MSAWDEVRSAIDEFEAESEVIACAAMRARVDELERQAADEDGEVIGAFLGAIHDELHYANELKRWELEFRRDSYLGKGWAIEQRPLPDRLCVDLGGREPT